MYDYNFNSIANIFITNVSAKIIPHFNGECFQCCFLTESYSDAVAEHLLSEKLPPFLNKAVNKRKAEFVAGRYLAKLALEVLGAECTHVGFKKNRAPKWPRGYTGSISHSNGFAMCGIASDYDFKSIGIDVEDIISPEVATNILDYVLVGSEMEIVDGDLNLLTLVFSAKESLFKALYSEVGFYFGFECAIITMIDRRTSSFTLELVKNLGPNLAVGKTFNGTFDFTKGRVFTAICRPAV